MRFLKGILACSLLVLGTGGLAQLDPGPDGLGLYFDESATEASAMVSEGTEYLTAYLILTNPTVAGNLNHWSAGVSAFLGGPGNAAIAGSPVVGHNLAINMLGMILRCLLRISPFWPR